MNSANNEISTRKLLSRLGLRLLLVVILGIICIKFGGTILNYFLPFILAYFVSSVFLMPIIRKLSGKFEHFRRFWAIVFVIFIMCIAVFLISAIVYYLFSQISDMIKNWNQYLNGLDELARSIANIVSSRTSISYESVLNYLYSVGEKIKIWATTELPGMAAPTLVDGIGNYAPTIGNFFLAFLFFMMGTYYICADYPIIRMKLKMAVPREIQPHIEQVQKAAGSATFGYLKAQFIISFMVSLIAFTVLLIIGQDYAALFAILIGVMDFIPLLGGSVILVPWIIMLLITGNHIKAIVLAILAFGIFLFRRIVEPKIVGNQTGLHPLISLITLYVGIKFGGIVGMIVMPIVCMIFIALYKVGFFKPTVNDIKLLAKRIMKYSDFN